MLFEDLDTKKEYVFITFKELKHYLLVKKASKPQLNIKIYSLEDLEKGVFGETTLESIKESLPVVGDDFCIAKKFISYIKKGVDTKIDKRIELIKENLISKDLLFIDPNFAQVFKNKEILILGYSKDNIELNHCLKKLEILNPTYLNLDSLFSESDFDVYKFNRNDEEIRFAFTKILDLLKEGIEPNKIQILTDTSVNYFYLKLFEKEFGLVLDIDKNQTLYDTKIAKILEKNIEHLSKENIDSYNDDSEEFEDIKEILNYFDFYNLKNKLLNFKNILKEYKLKNILNTESIKVTSSLEFDEGKHIFILGFDDNFYGKSSKNNDYFDDNLKKQYLLNTSGIKNVEYDIIYEFFLRTKNVFHLYYHESDGLKRDISFYLHKRYPNKKVQELHIKNPGILKKDYSLDIAKAYYSYYFDLKYKYYLHTEYYDLYKNYFGKLTRFDPDFSGVNVKKDGYKNYSYSAMDNFYACPFKYFCDKILKLEEFSSNYFTDAGNMIHKVLEKVYDDSLEFDEVYETVYKDYQEKFDDVEKKMIIKLKKVAKYLFYKLRNDFKENKLTKSYSEKAALIEDNKHDYKINGRIDSILETSKNGQKEIQIIDYKTGNTSKINDNCYYGRNLQLPIYMFLTKHMQEFKDATIVGTYYVHLNDSNRYNNFYENDFELSKDAYLKEGITIGDVETYKAFENNINETRKSEQVLGLKLKQDGSFYNHKEYNFTEPLVALDDDGVEREYPSLVRQAFNEFSSLIDKNYFEISPYFENNSDEGPCRYCPFKDVCFNNHKFDRIKKPIVRFKGYEYDKKK